jgi:predicted MPP superfamily phosphohydrolase
MALAGWSIAAALAAIGAHATLRAPRDLRVEDVDVPITGLAEAFEGYRIAVLTDLHHHPALNRVVLERAVAEAVAWRPDLIALLGDYGLSFEGFDTVSHRLYAAGLASLAVLLAPLRAPDGVVGVLGNHDHFGGVAPLTRRALTDMGVTLLENSALHVVREGAPLIVAGVGDADLGVVDLASARSGAPGDAPTVVLSHSPDGVLALEHGHRVDVVLSGHTHGGQVVLPGWGAILTMSRVCRRRTASGWVPNARAPLYVSRGIGTQIPLRFWCPPELTRVRLRRAPQQPA